MAASTQQAAVGCGKLSNVFFIFSGTAIEEKQHDLETAV